jgi:hypothetical protein
MADHAANALRAASDSICSAAGVNRERLTSPMRLKVRRATGSHRSLETPSANIAMARRSSASRSVHKIPSIACLGSSLIAESNDISRRLKID